MTKLRTILAAQDARDAEVRRDKDTRERVGSAMAVLYDAQDIGEVLRILAVQYGVCGRCWSTSCTCGKAAA